MEDRFYPKYLKKLVMDKNYEKYGILLDRLWKKEYYSILPNDQNRAKDGVLLRDIPNGPDYRDYYGPCSVLEMLIALAKRMEYEILGTGYDKTYKDLFWEMINNLGLLRFDDLNIMYDAQTNELDYILTRWIERQYYSDGSDGIFPIKNWKRGIDEPQTHVEIWYQMMKYLEKNYSFR